jgi:uncharacterized protein
MARWVIDNQQLEKSNMKMNDSQIIDAPRETVWKGLNDPKILQKCIPGCETIEVLSPTDLKATVVVKVGPVKASFAGEVTLSDLNPPESYRISGKGSGGFAGHASGGATVKLTALSPKQTQMDYTVDAQIGGKLAMLGSRLIDSTANSLAGQFFTKFSTLMKAEGSTAKPKAPAKKEAVQKKAAGKKKAAAKKKAPAKKAVSKKAKKKR